MSEKYKFGLHSLLLSETFTKDDLDILERAKRWGFDGVEIIPINLDDLPKAKIVNLKEELDIEINMGISLNENQNLASSDPEIRSNGKEYLKKIIDIGDEIGAENLIGVIYSAVGYMSDIDNMKEKWDLASKEFREIARYAKDNSNMNLCIEPSNRYETNLINTVQEVNKFIEKVGFDNVKINLDTYHMIREEWDIEEAVFSHAFTQGAIIKREGALLIGNTTTTDEIVEWEFDLNNKNEFLWNKSEGIDRKQIIPNLRLFLDISKIANKGVNRSQFDEDEEKYEVILKKMAALGYTYGSKEKIQRNREENKIKENLIPYKNEEQYNISKKKFKKLIDKLTPKEKKFNLKGFLRDNTNVETFFKII